MDYIYKYLNEWYEILTSEIGNDGIYKKDDTRKHKAPCYHISLTKELNSIFSLSKETLKDLINIWAESQKVGVDLEFFWADNSSFLVSSDLISIQPMDGPMATSFYLTFIYSGDWY